MARFQGKNIVVTGGTGILGRSVVDAFLAEGATCFVPTICNGQFETDKVTVVRDIDLSDEDKVVAFYRQVPGVDAVVNIAGGFLFAPIAETAASDLHKQLSMNLVSCYLSNREAVKAMRDTGRGGAIVNIAARAALQARSGANMTAYTTAKAGIAALTQALAEEVKGDNIRVNAIAPSIIDTPTNRQDMPDADFDSWVSPTKLAATILALCSDDLAASSGTIVEAYGSA